MAMRKSPQAPVFSPAIECHRPAEISGLPGVTPNGRSRLKATAAVQVIPGDRWCSATQLALAAGLADLAAGRTHGPYDTAKEAVEAMELRMGRTPPEAKKRRRPIGNLHTETD